MKKAIYSSAIALALLAGSQAQAVPFETGGLPVNYSAGVGLGYLETSPFAILGIEASVNFLGKDRPLENKAVVYIDGEARLDCVVESAACDVPETPDVMNIECGADPDLMSFEMAEAEDPSDPADYGSVNGDPVSEGKIQILCGSVSEPVSLRD